MAIPAMMARAGIVAFTSVKPGAKRAEEPATLRHQGRVLLQPEAESLNEEVQHANNAQLNAHGPRNPQFATVQRNGTVKESREDSTDRRENQNRGNKTENSRENGKLEDVKTHVKTKFWINTAEGFAVHPQQELWPRSGSPQTRKQAQQRGDSEHCYPTNGVDYLPVPVEFVAELGIDGTETVRKIDGQPHGDKHGDETDEEHGHGSTPVREENLEVTQLVKPQNLGVERGKKEESTQHHADGNNGDDEGGASGIEKSGCCLRHGEGPFHWV